MPRCGSSVAAQLLLQYMLQYRDYQQHSPILTGQNIEWFGHTNIERLANRIGTTKDKAKKQAYILIRQATGLGTFPVIKNIITAVDPVTHPFMLECGYRILKLKRRNLIEQYVSHMVAVRSYYHVPKGTDLSLIDNRVAPFEATQESIDAFKRHYDLLESYHSHATLYYEDFIDDYQVLFNTIGKPTVDSTIYADKLTTERMPAGLLQYITNLDTVYEWFDKWLGYYIIE
jgi:hypothetical protein